MCGASLRPEASVTANPPSPAPVSQPTPSAQDQPAPVRPEPPRTSSDTSPLIAGHSFLGLNQPAPSSRASNLAPGHHHDKPSRDLDYLLEDDEEHKPASGKWILLLLALALCAVFGYLHWKQGGFAWLNSETKKPPAAATAQPSDTTQPAPAAAAPAPSDTAAPAPSPGANSGAPADTPPSAPATTTPDNPAASAPAAAAAPSSSDTNPPQPKPDSAAPDNTDPNLPANKPLNPAPARPAHASLKPAPSRPSRPLDTVAEAEKYIYGRGVPQDCERGLRLLKPAADQAIPKAMVSLGALYSTGLCTPRDLPTAYRWFSLALKKEPDSVPLQENIERLWNQMTQPERQLAIKLSQ